MQQPKQLTIVAAITVFLGIFNWGPALAEETQNIQVGAKVRATVPKEYSAYTSSTSGNETSNVLMDDFETKPLKTERFAYLTGTLLYFDETTITLETSRHSPPVQILRQDISKLELFKGSRSGDAGGWLGFGVGAALGYLMGKTAGDDPPPDEMFEISMSSGTKAGFGAVVFGALGAVIGYRVYEGDVWEAVPTDKLQLGISHSAQGGSGLFLTARF